MPFRRSPQALGSVLHNVIDEMGIQQKLDEARAIETWATLAGPQINGITESVWVRGGRLYVKVNSAAWRNELHLSRQRWCQHLNANLGNRLVREIVFR